MTRLDIAVSSVDGPAVADSDDIVVVGAGVLGLCVAVELTMRGRNVRVIDPGFSNASSIAAGMIAPAFESLLDGVDAARAGLLRDAAALWPAFARRVGLTLDMASAEWRGPGADAVAARLEALGFAVERNGDRVRAPQDIRLDAAAAMQRLARRLAAPLIPGKVLSMAGTGSRWHLETDSGDLGAGHVVVATGALGPPPGLPPAVVGLIGNVRPISGQIGDTREPLADRVLRGQTGYVVPGDGGSLIGATMVDGVRIEPDPTASRDLVAAAETLIGRTLGAPVRWRVGVRGATADGLPMAGPAGVAGLHLALAPRRNGWLLGPLVARIVADGIEGRRRGSHAAALDPLRFSPREE